MTADPDPAELIGSVAGEDLLESTATNLPGALGHPESIPETRARARIVAAGATMTGVTLVGGIALIALSLVSSFSNGVDLLKGVLFALGMVLVATHWGWVHVAEATAQAVEARSSRDVIDRRHQWLLSIAPYTRHEVTTEVQDDGSIAIIQVAYRPVPLGGGRFSFEPEVERREVYSGEDPAAAVAEHAERMRRDAALATEREHERFLAAADDRETTMLLEEDEAERLRAQREASRALSEQINTHLRQPPLEE